MTNGSKDAIHPSWWEWVWPLFLQHPVQKVWNHVNSDLAWGKGGYSHPSWKNRWYPDDHDKQIRRFFLVGRSVDPPFFWVWSKTRIIKFPILGGDQTWCIFFKFWMDLSTQNALFGSAMQWFLKNWPPLLRKKHVAWVTFWPKFSKATESAPRQGPQALTSATMMEGDVVMTQRPMERGMIWESLMFFLLFLLPWVEWIPFFFFVTVQ